MVLVLVLPAAAGRGSWNNWHVHDGGSPAAGPDANGLVHRGLVFFPQIFGADYASTPDLWAYCPNATDKALIGGTGGAKGAAGMCQNENSIIHLQQIGEGAQEPGGPWLPVPGWDGFYYFLTER